MKNLTPYPSHPMTKEYMDYINQRQETLSGLTRQENDARCTWLRHVLLVISTLFGILISLHNTSPHILFSRLCFSLSNILLAVGITGLLWVLYNYSAKNATGVRNAYRNELIAAYKEQREMAPAGTNISKSVLLVEKIAYGCIGTAFLLLAVFSLMAIF